MFASNANKLGVKWTNKVLTEQLKSDGGKALPLYTPASSNEEGLQIYLPIPSGHFRGS